MILDEKEKIETDEYKKRIKELIDRVEKNKEKDKDTPVGEQQVIEAKERLLQTAKSKIHPLYRSERIILVFTYLIRDYYRRRADLKVPLKKVQLQEEMDVLYKLIYEELKKPSLHNPNLNPYRRNTADIIDKRRILEKMTQVLGEENIRIFYKDYDVRKLVHSASRWKNNWLTGKEKVCLTVIVFIIIFFGMLFGMFL